MLGLAEYKYSGYQKPRKATVSEPLSPSAPPMAPKTEVVYRTTLAMNLSEATRTSESVRTEGKVVTHCALRVSNPVDIIVPMHKDEAAKAEPAKTDETLSKAPIVISDSENDSHSSDSAPAHVENSSDKGGQSENGPSVIVFSDGDSDPSPPANS
jgi:hypothetical protein